MKRIVFISLIIFALLPAWSHGQEVAIDWARMDSLVADGFFSTARPMVERAWRQAQASGDGRECLRATFYLTAIDYAFAKDAVDSAIMRYSALARSLAGADKAVAYVFLLQSYDMVYSQRYYSYGRNSVSDDPKLHYLLWHRQRMEDTLMACLDSIVAQDKVLRETSVEGYRMMFRCDSLTMPPIDSTLLGLLAQSALNVDLRSLREKVLALFAGLYADGNANGRLWFDLQRPAYIPSDSLYLVSLDSLEECYHGVMLSDDMRALLNYKRASAMSVAGHKVMAEELCMETERRYPDTYGGCCCRQLRKQICSKEFTINYSRTESSCGKRLAVVEARNTDLLHMRLVRRDSLPEGRLWPKDTLWGIDAVAEWEQPLPDPGDHLAHRWLVALPAVEQGQYYLMAYADRMEYALYESADAAFIAYSLPAAAGKWTQLSPSSGHLVDRVTGMPWAGRKVTLHGEGVLTENDRRCRRRTDKEGYFHFPVSSARYWLTDYDEMSANVDGYEPSVATESPLGSAASLAEEQTRPEIDRWILSCLNTLIKKVKAEMDNFDPTRAGRFIDAFVNDDLSNWFVRLNRKRFWGKEMDADKRSAYDTLSTCMMTVAKLIAPFAPFYADQLYRDLGGQKDSVHLDDFPVADESLIDTDLEARMEMAQKITSMVLALRRKVNIKVRQPLQSIMVPATDEQKKHIEAVKQLIMNEVNVKELKFVEGQGILVKKVKCNFRTMGKKFGKLMKGVAAAMDALSQEQIAELEQQGTIGISVEGQNLTVEAVDVDIISEDIPGWLVANEGALTVALEVELTDELKNEGMARELINRIQNIRKESGLEITDRIIVTLSPNDDVEKAVNAFGEYVKTQVLADSIVIAANDGQEVDFDDFKLNINITKS